jgi:hypothetical protein
MNAQTPLLRVRSAVDFYERYSISVWVYHVPGLSNDEIRKLAKKGVEDGTIDDSDREFVEWDNPSDWNVYRDNSKVVIDKEGNEVA